MMDDENKDPFLNDEEEADVAVDDIDIDSDDADDDEPLFDEEEGF